MENERDAASAVTPCCQNVFLFRGVSQNRYKTGAAGAVTPHCCDVFCSEEHLDTDIRRVLLVPSETGM